MKRKRKQKTRAVTSTPPAPIVNIAERRSLRASLEPNRKPSIFISCPTTDGMVHYSIAMTFGRAMASSMMPDCPFRFMIHPEPGKRPIDYARNCIVKEFMRSDADWLMMIDADQGVPENFWKLCTVTDADIVSGITPVWVSNMAPEAMLRVNNYGLDENGQCYNLPIPDDNIKAPYKVPILGTGCIAIRRRVFAPTPHGLGLNPFGFTYSEDRKIAAGEDINFSVAANRAGFTLAVFPEVVFDHQKLIPLLQVKAYAEAYHQMMTEGRVTTDEQRLSIG